MSDWLDLRLKIGVAIAVNADQLSGRRVRILRKQSIVETNSSVSRRFIINIALIINNVSTIGKHSASDSLRD